MFDHLEYVKRDEVMQLKPGEQVYLHAVHGAWQDQVQGYWEVISVRERGEAIALEVLPEALWDELDPVARRAGYKHFRVSAITIQRVAEHAPVCRVCGELWPCNHREDLRKLNLSITAMEDAEYKKTRDKETRRRFKVRYTTPGVCPACMQPVTEGQPYQTFEDNAVYKKGPAVTYHLSRKCSTEVKHHSMHDYLGRLRKAGVDTSKYTISGA